MDERQAQSKQLTFRQYNQIIRKRVFERIKQIPLGFSVGVPLVLQIVVAVWGMRQPSNEVAVNTAVALAVLTVVFYAIVYLVFFSQEHVTVYNGQANALSEYQVILPARLKIVCGRNEDFQFGALARIMVKNISGDTIDNVRIELKDSKPKTNSGVSKVALHIMHDNPKIAGQPHVRQKVLTFGGYDEKYFDVGMKAESGDIRIEHAEQLEQDLFILDPKPKVLIAVYGDRAQIEQWLTFDYDSAGQPYIKPLPNRKSNDKRNKQARAKEANQETG